MMIMKMHIRILAMMAVVLGFTSCLDEQYETNQGGSVDAGTQFTITLNPATKTANNGLQTLWVEGDKVNVFHAVAGTTDYVNDGAFEFESGSNFSGYLSRNLESDKLYDWYVSYPYDEKMTSPKEMTINIPADQYQSEDGSMAHLAGSLCPLAGKAKSVSCVSSVVVSMKQLVTIMKIKVTNYEANPMDLNLVSFMANGCTHENEVVNLMAGAHARTITGTYTVDFTGEKLVYTHVDKGMGTGSPRPLIHLDTPKTIGLNESATLYLATIPFYIPNATSYTIGMNNNSGGVTMSIYGKNVACEAGQICSVRQGSRLEPPFKDGINFYHGQKNADGTYTFQDGWWRCDLPSDFQFSGEFDFADLFYTCNVDAWIDINEIGSGNQNTLVQNEYNDVANCIQSRVQVKDGGGVWKKNGRWKSNFNVNWDNDKNGVFLKWHGGYNPGGPECSWYIWFRIQDPFKDKLVASNGVNRLRNDSFDSYYLFSDEHYRGRLGWVTGGDAIAKDIHINTIYNTHKNYYRGAEFKDVWSTENHLVASDGRVLIQNDLATNSFGLTEEAAKYCQQSKGLYWIPAHYVEFASPTNPGEYEKIADPESREQEANLAAELEAFGITMTENGHIKLGDNYDTTKKFCITPRIKFEYDYGTIVYTYGSRYLPGLCINI